MHAFKDQLVRSALLALYTARPGCVLKKPAVPRNCAEEGDDLKHQDHPSQVKRQDSIPHHSEYDEEEWVSSWNIFGWYWIPKPENKHKQMDALVSLSRLVGEVIQKY